MVPDPGMVLGLERTALELHMVQALQRTVLEFHTGLELHMVQALQRTVLELHMVPGLRTVQVVRRTVPEQHMVPVPRMVQGHTLVQQGCRREVVQRMAPGLLGCKPEQGRRKLLGPSMQAQRGLRRQEHYPPLMRKLILELQQRIAPFRITL